MFSTSRSGRSYGAALRDLSEGSSAEVRAEAAQELAAHVVDDPSHRAEATQALIEALHDKSAEVRGAVALCLADIEAKEAIGALIEATEDGQERVQQMALTALGEIGGARGLPIIEKSLEADAAAMRFAAVMAFVRVSDDRQRKIEVLLDASRDRDDKVRHIALRMAEELGDEEGPVDLRIQQRCVALLDDDSHIVPVAAAVILGRAGRHDGREILVGVATREVMTPEHDDEAAALELLGEMGYEEAIPGLERRGFKKVILLTNDPFAWQARVALARMGHAKATKWICSELEAWTRERRGLAVEAAKRGRVKAAIPILKAMRGDAARADPDAVEEALAQLE